MGAPAENTKKSYLSSVTGLARHYRRSPERVSAQEVQDYLIHLHEQRGLTWKSCNCARHGIRFFYRITLGLPEPHSYLPGAKTPSTLPEILNREELLRLFTVTANPKHLHLADDRLRRRASVQRTHPPARVRHRFRAHVSMLT